jgi:hypothetical protein
VSARTSQGTRLKPLWALSYCVMNPYEVRLGWLSSGKPCGVFPTPATAWRSFVSGQSDVFPPRQEGNCRVGGSAASRSPLSPLSYRILPASFMIRQEPLRVKFSKHGSGRCCPLSLLKVSTLANPSQRTGGDAKRALGPSRRLASASKLVDATLPDGTGSSRSSRRHRQLTTAKEKNVCSTESATSATRHRTPAALWCRPRPKIHRTVCAVECEPGPE